MVPGVRAAAHVGAGGTVHSTIAVPPGQLALGEENRGWVWEAAGEVV